jgi:hypothetical protein
MATVTPNYHRMNDPSLVQNYDPKRFNYASGILNIPEESDLTKQRLRHMGIIGNLTSIGISPNTFGIVMFNIPKKKRDLSRKRLLELSKKNRPPQSWYEADEENLF